MEEEFYATIKLVSGEELVSKVCYLPDEDKIMLEKPLVVETARQKKGQVEVSGFQLKEWIQATFDQMFIIDRDKIITISEVEGKISDFYKQTLTRLDAGRSASGHGNKLPRDSGYLGSVEKMKKTLENIFDKS
ncbi:methylamine utilization [Synechococcus phage ACG-2014h]|uniref:Sm-like domain-containing protein n=1 Tax=Synechococcus phage ACG-2014h TaxID=1340810 RepID=V5URD5_9CAUD|nr:methylamine utilization [Synechococcus phage ACG-2014h]AHB80536.1 hypothetical protein S-MbCM7_122 [Synechococcus phage ACG-2014h]